MSVVGTIYSQELPNGDEYKLGDKPVRDSIADEFDATQAYAIDDYVEKDGVLYKFKAAHTANEPWDPTEVDAVQLVNEMKDPVDVSNKADKTDLAPAFNSAAAYDAGDMVVYEKVLYTFTADKAAGAWDSTKVTPSKVSENIKHYTFTVTGTKLVIGEASV